MNIIKLVFIACLAIQVISCKPSEKKEVATELNAPEKLATASVNIEGMTCEIGCAKTIESKISKLEGITESKVNFEAKKGTFTYDSNKTSEEKIINTINNLLDGKTYKANILENSCKPGCEKPCCATKEKVECSKECADKCGHKEGESCKKSCVDKNDTSEKECKAEHSEKSCCKDEKKDCETGCEKACCTTKK